MIKETKGNIYIRTPDKKVVFRVPHYELVELTLAQIINKYCSVGFVLSFK